MCLLSTGVLRIQIPPDPAHFPVQIHIPVHMTHACISTKILLVMWYIIDEKFTYVYGGEGLTVPARGGGIHTNLTSGFLHTIKLDLDLFEYCPDPQPLLARVYMI